MLKRTICLCLILTLLIVVFPTTVSAATYTPAAEGEFKGNTYAVYDNTLSWTAAESYCKSIGGHLVTITSEDETNYLCDLVKNTNRPFYYIGFTDRTVEGTWEWITGETSDYTNWMRGEPNTNTGVANCDYAMFVMPRAWHTLWQGADYSHHGGWADETGKSHSYFGFICEWDAETVTLDIIGVDFALSVGETLQLEVEITPSSAFETQDIELEWYSLDPSVASVDENGVVTGVSAGETQVWVETTDGELSDVAYIDVVDEASMLVPFKDLAFSFANWSNVDGMSLAMYQSVFKPEIGLYYKTVSNIADLIDAGHIGSNGMCAGMAITTMLFQNGYRDLDDYGDGTMESLSRSSGRVDNLIEYTYLCQFKQPFMQEKNKNRTDHSKDKYKEDNAQKVDALAEYAQENLTYITVDGARGGHALVANGINADCEYNRQPCSKVNVYNCNRPDDKNQYIVLYKDEHGDHTGEWEHIGSSGFAEYSSSQEDGAISFVTYDTIIKSIEGGAISYFSLLRDPAYITVLRNGEQLMLTDKSGRSALIRDGHVEEDEIEDITLVDKLYEQGGLNYIYAPDDEYTIDGLAYTAEGADILDQTVVYSDSDAIVAEAGAHARITFNVRDAGTESLMADNFLNIDTLGVLSAYSVTYMPFELYDYPYDTVAIRGETDGVVKTYESEGNVYITGEDAFAVVAVIGNEQIELSVSGLDKDALYCIKIDDGSMEINCENEVVTKAVQLPSRQKALQPEYDLESGSYSGKQTLTLEYPNRMTNLYYTTDGSDPTADMSLLYTTPIVIDKDTTVKILATQYGCLDSDILELDYCVKEYAEQTFNIAGTNMTLGNKLEVNFMFPKASVTGTDYTAVITQTLADGTERITEIDESGWATYGTRYYKVSAVVNAKEMADRLSVEIVDADGYVVNNAYSTSVRDYAGRAMAATTTTEYVRIMMIDMLNYGAAAQQHFGYSTDDLANSILTDEQQALATAKVACTNGQVKDATIYGSNLSLEDSILLNTFFKGLKGKDIASMYAMVNFTDFQGNAKEVRMEGSEFEKYGSSGDIYKIVVDDVVLADARQLVTVTLYNADGTVFGAGTDSVESYVARAEKNNADTYGLYANIMKFATSAYNYITNK